EHLLACAKSWVAPGLDLARLWQGEAEGPHSGQRLVVSFCCHQTFSCLLNAEQPPPTPFPSVEHQRLSQELVPTAGTMELLKTNVVLTVQGFASRFLRRHSVLPRRRRGA